MLFERIESRGLAHYSYMIGDGQDAVVIDSRRDCEVYVRRAHQEGMSVRHILETHRNEDYVIGSVELASRTGAQIWHAEAQMDYQYGEGAVNGQTWTIGDLRLEAISTPGHTPGSMSYLLRDGDGVPWIVFTGDALFAGDAGRVDLPGLDRMAEMANLLYDSLYHRLLPLGDGVLVCPGHGAGSVCGSAISGRSITTIGLERQHNPKLQYNNREDFVANVARELERPPYFRRMEVWNLQGPPLLGLVRLPPPLAPSKFAAAMEGAVVLDTRDEMAFGAAHIPGALFIWEEGLASYAGWFLPYDRPILLVCHEKDVEEVTRTLLRLGFDNVVGYLAGGMHAWHAAGYDSETVKMATIPEFLRLRDAGRRDWILDVRTAEEVETEGTLEGAQHIPIRQVLENLAQVPQDREIQLLCGTGLRATTAASLLKSHGREQITVLLGGASGLRAKK